MLLLSTYLSSEAKSRAVSAAEQTSCANARAFYNRQKRRKQSETAVNDLNQLVGPHIIQQRDGMH
jgi:hypothetical protein